MPTHTTSTARANGERGFTIVEVLISLLIFSIAIVGVITVAAQGGLNVDDSKLSLTASYLADEGVELMRAMRDTSVVSATVAGSTSADGWTAFATAFGATSGACTSPANGNAPCDIDPTVLSTPFPTMANVVNCSTLTDGYCPLYAMADGSYSDTAGLVGGVPADPSPYSRKIIVTPVSDDESTVTVTVKYQEGAGTKTVTETEELFNWY